MFGRENCGLNNKEIAYANKIITIDTDSSFSSLNIAHSVAVICYELFQGKKNARADLQNIQTLATKSEIEYFYQHLFAELDKRDFFKIADKKEVMSIKIRNLFSKIENLSHSEIQMLRGIVSVLSNKKG
jgi:tRNA C32,U32 (ribose-2'-O)-methylase TrmJ